MYLTMEKGLQRACSDMGVPKSLKNIFLGSAFPSGFGVISGRFFEFLGQKNPKMRGSGSKGDFWVFGFCRSYPIKPENRVLGWPVLGPELTAGAEILYGGESRRFRAAYKI